jgi:hypothetical protein
MFLFLSFIVAIAALFMLSDIASSHYYYSEQNFSAAIVLLIYSLVCIIKEIKGNTSSFFDDDDYFTNNSRMNSYSQKYNHNYYGDIVDDHNDWFNKYGSRNVETFAPDKKEEKNTERPKVLHYPSNKEVRDKISDLEQNRWWKIKRGFCSFWGIDITESFYEPTYIEEEAAVKVKKENHSRYMPGNDWIREKENKEYNEVAKRLSRSCDIAFDGENFVENEDIK